MGRLIVVAICILGFVGWGLALVPELRSDSHEAPAATAVSGDPSRSTTPELTATLADETDQPTRRPTRTEPPPTLPLGGNQTPRPTRTPT
jgi:hypothetical protein